MGHAKTVSVGIVLRDTVSLWLKNFHKVTLLSVPLFLPLYLVYSRENEIRKRVLMLGEHGELAFLGVVFVVALMSAALAYAYICMVCLSVSRKGKCYIFSLKAMVTGVKQFGRRLILMGSFLAFLGFLGSLFGGIGVSIAMILSALAVTILTKEDTKILQAVSESVSTTGKDWLTFVKIWLVFWLLTIAAKVPVFYQRVVSSPTEGWVELSSIFYVALWLDFSIVPVALSVLYYHTRGDRIQVLARHDTDPLGTSDDFDDDTDPIGLTTDGVNEDSFEDDTGPIPLAPPEK